MRIYIPATFADLELEEITPRAVHCVTEGLLALSIDDDPEVLDEVAMNAAADNSLLMLGSLVDEEKVWSRCVLVADVPQSWLGEGEGSTELPTHRLLLRSVPWKKVASIHVDDPEISPLVERAAGGDDEAFNLLVEEEDLMWFDAMERGYLRSMRG